MSAQPVAGNIPRGAPPVHVLKLSIFFQMLGQGWSEVYYLNNPSDPVTFIYGDVTTVDPDGFGSNSTRQILSTRGALLVNTAYITHIRASLEGSPNVAAGISFGTDGYQGKWTKLVNYNQVTQLPPYQRLLLKSYSSAATGSVSSNHYLGGLSTSLQALDGHFNHDGDFQKHLDNFVVNFKGLGWCAKVRPHAAAATVITAFAPAADGLTASVAPVPPEINAPGTYSVLIRGLKIPHGWNGQHRGIVATNLPPLAGNTLTIGPLRKPGVTVPPWTAANPGTVAGMVPTYPPIIGWIPQHFLKKDTGRPFGVPRGRSTRS